ncbi:glutamate-cysteine ligase family protein [Oxalobacteraceae bacterium R-40]|uniref:Glutamate-cysteine ligase family protein n=1 Tax=Keguizhuia sedimenti TaxID=3064264 RepID=A0ABU1BN53_9BURK|nr:glutamate-cysteine ligase family protein [Oxalobacteraceae bacterium R-40]
MTTRPPESLPAFSACGIELEYMIVDRQDLSILPIADQILRGEDEEQVNDVARGLMGWSNELVRHLLELKNRQPVASLDKLPAAFQNEIRFLNHLLGFYGAMLMPSAMHPWMDPGRETHLWPHENAELYAAYARIFQCNTHGWSNLQSMHINLPFANDEEFARLHAAVRLLLPILPALAASSPIADGKATGFADFRMETYRSNADKIPSIAGLVVPENVSSRAEYEALILHPMYRDIAPFDPQGILQHEWLNSRGAIARFDRNTIEIRVIDVQECPQADLAIAAAAIANVRMLYDAGRTELAAQQALPTERLAAILLACIRNADQAVIDDEDYLRALGLRPGRYTATEVWRQLLIRTQQSSHRLDAPWMESLQAIMAHGPLARRILHAVDNNYSPANVNWVYRQLCQCLQSGHMFLPS